MAISFKRYIDIVSGVGGGAGVRQRDLILRLFTTSMRVPAEVVIEMESPADVAAYFGISSPEYARAVAYFGFVSKNISSPKKISFSRWADVDAAARIFGSGAAPLASLTPVTAGSFKLTLGSHTADVTGINLGSAANLAAVATAVQTAIRAETAGGAAWTSATVTYDAPTNSFNLVGGDVGVSPLALAPAASGTPLASLLGWGALAVLSPGVAAQEPVEALIAGVQASDNFATFAYIAQLTDSQILAVATQNDTYNVKFHYTIAAPLDIDGPEFFDLLGGLSGVSWTFSPKADEFPELLPAAILAATDYSKRNSTQNYMYQQATLSPSVSTDVLATFFDNSRTNYYGRTQTAGQFIDFYQRGVMGGLATDPVDMNTYANEIWLKDAAGAALMSLLLSLAKVSANAEGRSQLLAVLLDVVERATFNGTISVGKPLNITQKLYIGNMTGDPEAWKQVEGIGYWLDVVLRTEVTQDGRTEWHADYVLIYSKDDVIRKVNGQHVLI